MKKLLALLLAAALLLSLCACGSPSKPKELEDISDEDWEAAAEALEDMYEEEPAVETEAAKKIYEIGDTIVTADGMVEFTLDSFCFGDYRDGMTYLPADSGDIYHTAEEGKTFCFFSGTMTLVGEPKEKSSYWLYDIKADYMDGYIFGEGEPFPTNTYELDGSRGGSSAEFEPFVSTNVREVRGFVEVPDVVENDTENSLLLYFIINGSSGDSGCSPKVECVVRLR